MHFLEFSTAQPCLRSNLYAFRSHSLFSKNEKRFPCLWRYFHDVVGKPKRFNSTRIEVWRAGLSIEAVATLERAGTAQTTRKNDEQSEYRNLRIGIALSSSTSNVTEQPSLIEDSGEVDDREKLRRERISKANKGNTPWNKGKKHSPETLRRIKERTRLAMQDPKVKMKLANMGHAQTEETRTKIGLGVRIGWEKRREKLMLQETCYYQWQNLLAEASRKGLLGEGELQWDSYKILDEQLEQEWLQSMELRRQTPRPKGSKRAPKSPEQRRKIAEAIAAKWADPDYRTRVCSGLAKYHGIPEGVERKPRRKPSVNGETRRRSASRKKVDDVDEFMKLETKTRIRIKMKRSKVPRFKDPLASSKLEMLKNIRAQRASAEKKESEAISRAKALIAEAEKAAKALEAAAEQSPLAMASLIETRKLIAEATQSLESIENAQLDSPEKGSTLDPITHPEQGAKAITTGVNGTNHIKVNGTHLDVQDLELNKSALHDVVNGASFHFLEPSSTDYNRLNGEENLSISSSDYDLFPDELNEMVKHSAFTRKLGDHELNGSEQNKNSLLLDGAKAPSENEAPTKSIMTTKRWVRGRLVEMVERD